VQVLLLSMLDLPFSISPVVTGLMLMLLYGRAGWFAQALAEHGLSIVFAFPGAVLAATGSCLIAHVHSDITTAACQYQVCAISSGDAWMLLCV